MPFYRENLHILRAMLAGTILMTFALGTLSVVLIRSKVCGLAGIGLGIVAIVMGGSKAEAIATERRAMSAGLDYFVLELLVLGLLFVPMERLWPLREQKIFRNGWQTDLTHFFTSHAGVQLLSFLTVIPVQVVFAWTVEFEFQKHVAAQPVWLQFFEMLFVADLFSYWVHRAFHTFPLLWKFHAIHHRGDPLLRVRADLHPRLFTARAVRVRAVRFVPRGLHPREREPSLALPPLDLHHAGVSPLAPGQLVYPFRKHEETPYG